MLTWTIVGCAGAQNAVFSNGNTADPSDPGLSTGVSTLSGVPAPSGLNWSETPSLSDTEANAIGGFSGHLLGLAGTVSPFRFADDFTVPAVGRWQLTSVSFYAYQTGAVQAPFSGVSLRVWNGRPDLPGSTVLWGDLGTNLLAGCTATSTCRVFNTRVPPVTAPDTSRLIWRVDAAINGLLLIPGSYWLEWQFASIDPLGDAFVPPVTAAGARTRPNANAMQFRTTSAGGAWTALLDTGKPASAADLPQDLPFILRGTLLLPAACLADIVSIGGQPPADGLVTGDDFIAFVNAFASGDALADVVAIGGDPPPDGLVTGDDFIAFINTYATGCP